MVKSNHYPQRIYHFGLLTPTHFFRLQYYEEIRKKAQGDRQSQTITLSFIEDGKELFQNEKFLITI